MLLVSTKTKSEQTLLAGVILGFDPSGGERKWKPADVGSYRGSYLYHDNIIFSHFCEPYRLVHAIPREAKALINAFDKHKD